MFSRLSPFANRVLQPSAAFLNAHPWLPVLLAPLALIYLRAPDAFHHPTFWAEDGAIFFGQWQELGFASVVAPYNGYLHLAPRLVAALAGLIPLEHTIRVYFLASLAAALWTSATIYLNSPRRAASYPLYLLPFVALSATEVLATPTNLQWMLATGLMVALLAGEPRSPMVRANNALFAVVAGLSGPFAPVALCAALGAALLVRRPPSRAQWTLIAILAAATALQALFVVAQYAPSGGASTLAKVYAGFFAILRKSMGGSVETILISITVVLGAVFGAERRFRIGVLLFGFVLTLMIAVRFSVDTDVFENGISHRYRYVQSVMWIMILVSMAVDASAGYLRGLAALCLVLYAASLADGGVVRDPRVAIDDWAATVRAAEQGPVAYRFPPGLSVVVHGR